MTLMLCLHADLTLATGTPAGTGISSQAVMTYTRGSEAYSVTSNVTVLTVNEVLDFVVQWQDAGRVPVYAADAGAALAFRLQNTGNGADSYRLTGLDALAGDDFDPDLQGLYLDADGDGRFDPTVDQPYLLGVNDPELTPGGQQVVFAVCDIPAAAAEGALGSCKLVVGSSVGYGAPGTIVYGAGDDGTDVVIGPCGGYGEADGAYAVVTVAVALVKSAVVSDPYGGAQTVGGASVLYTITVTVSGEGTARGVVVSDPLPADTSYVPASLALNAAALTEATDADAGDVGQTVPGEVTVALGDLSAASPPQRISFRVVVQ